VIVAAFVIAAVAVAANAPPAAEPPGAQAWNAERRAVALHTAGVLLGMRVGAAVLWPGDYGLRSLSDAPSHLREAISRPPVFRTDRSLLESDGDPWTINVFGHGVFGSEIYLRSRQCGGGPLEAFAWTAGAAIATSKRPSAIDLAWTPIVGGLVLGELRFLTFRALAGPDPGVLRSIARAIVDPLGSLERAAGTKC
jgi:hypothetical protein